MKYLKCESRRYSYQITLKTMRKRMERHGTNGGIDLAREGSLYARGAAAGESI